MPKRNPIVVAVDGSDYSRTVAKEASKISSVTGLGAVLLSVVKEPAITTDEEGALKTMKREEREFELLHEDLIQAYFRNFGERVDSEVLIGDPAHKICEYANYAGATMIIIGTRGRSKVTSTLLGSVSANVIRGSKCPVLVVSKTSRTRSKTPE